MESLLLQLGGPLAVLVALSLVMRHQVAGLEKGRDEDNKEAKNVEARLMIEIGLLRNENRRIDGRVIALETARPLSDQETNRRLAAIEKAVEKIAEKLEEKK